MSRARRQAHRRLVTDQRRETRMRRRTEACRSVHWSPMWSGRTLDQWRRPEDQDVRTAAVSAQCPIHRGSPMLTVIVTITRMEERIALNFRDLGQLAEARIRGAERTLFRRLVPFRHRFQPSPPRLFA